MMVNKKIKQIPLSDSTVIRRTEILAEDVISQLDEAIQNAPCISLAVDESTDTTDNAKLLVFVRFYDETKKEFCQNLLGLTTIEAHTRGEDIHDAIKGMLIKRGIDLKSVFSITTDGALSRLKEDHIDLISYHSIIFQSVPCVSL